LLCVHWTVYMMIVFKLIVFKYFGGIDIV
jgi:hypothetical protein